MSSRITRSQSKAASKRKPLRQVASRESALSTREADLNAREANLSTREAVLNAAFANLNAREAELDDRESALSTREAVLNAAFANLNAREAKKSGKQYIIKYVSNYTGMEPESETFIGTDEKTAALAAFDWMAKNQKGLDFELAWEALQDQVPWHAIHFEGGKFGQFENENAIVAHVRKRCNSFKDLKKICNKYSDSYFEDSDGWNLKFSKI
jgi:hypothetical protein